MPPTEERHNPLLDNVLSSESSPAQAGGQRDNAALDDIFS
jgi:hypothetical protein